MPQKKTLRVDQLLQHSRGELNATLKKTRQLLAIEKQLKLVLPDTVASAIKVASFSNDTLHLVCPDAALATHLRYQQQTIISRLSARKLLQGLTKIDISVRPESEDTNEKPPVSRHISAKNRSLLTQTATFIDEPNLRNALINLAKVPE